MADMPMARQRENDPLALAALLAGVAALIAFIIAGFTTDALWGVGIVLAVVGVVLGWLGRRRAPVGTRSRMMATIGLIAAGIVIAWFLVFLIVEAIN